MITIGMRAHDLGTMNLAQLSSALHASGVGCIQLALSKALADFPYRPGTLSPGFAQTVRSALAARGVSIAVLGSYVNLIHPDPETRNQHLQRFAEHLQFSRDFGCSIVGTETGHKSSDGSPHPATQSAESFAELLSSAEFLAARAAQAGVFAALEPVADKHPLSTIERTAKLLTTLDHPNLKIIFDPVNLIPSQGIGDQTDFLTSAFQAFGEQMVCIHAKDFRIHRGQKIGTLPAGTGELDYPLLMKLIKTHKPGIHVLLENTSPESLPQAKAFLESFS
ncbi:sugar phosphate isomerase/epimerase family protein [Spirochaeta lutea]|uniref:Xylose isomerase-like TIM barrel domain-containing protein n=1 Tax=Spirochaeta lutea TaxID=1480694 RepID=A0A098QZ37_9SPIO|nr:sugar phosphate isomerase/epimerase family protein [Spirochaeta lutea]KGE72781.1 hypothetical protein DC28_05965 [Spirochaeta lutea]